YGDIGTRTFIQLRQHYRSAAIRNIAPNMPKDPAPWQIVADEDLPILAEGCCDLVLSVNSLHKIDDVPGALQNWRKTLRDDGLFHCVFLGGNTLQELRVALGNAEAEITGGARMRFHPMIALRDAGQLLQQAGFALCVTDREVVRVTFRDFRTMLHELRAMGEGNALCNPAPYLSRQVLARAEEIYWQRFSQSALLPMTFELLFMHGWAPHASQQKPSQPGSADIGLTTVFQVPKP
ncbi:MAG: methyltransferase domain-containing protein, partial [Pseudomonadota bacterium]